MSVKKEASRRRSIQLDFDVPGTPEEVWQAIATGPGISSWFVLSEVEEREGGSVAFHLGPGMGSRGRVTAWDPPRRFAYEEPEWAANAPPLATEFIIKTRSGVTSVRLVHSLFTTSDDWDDQFDGFEAGWPPFFDVLRLYLTHFKGQPCSPIRLIGNAGASDSQAWARLTTELGLAGATQGDRWRTRASGVPSLAGVIERTGTAKNPHELIARLDEPAPGIALMGVYTWGGQVHALVSLYLYDDRGTVAAERDQPLWRAWMNERFPSLGDAMQSAKLS